MIPSIIVVIALASSPVPTNLELVEQAVLESVEELPSRLLDQGVDTVGVEILGDHPGGWLLEQTATQILNSEGVTVSSVSRDPGSGYVLRLRPMDLAVRYGDSSRSWLIGSKKVDRHATCEISATLLSAGGTVIMSNRYGATVSDQVAVSDLSRLAGERTDPWLAPERTESGEGGILEPLIVSGVVASLIYLFYSSRAE